MASRSRRPQMAVGLAVLVVLAAVAAAQSPKPSPSPAQKPAAAQQSCVAVTAEFVLTGLGNKDGNARNHELGVCLPHFQLTLDTGCNLRIKPLYAQSATVSLLQIGAPGGKPNIPRATDPPSALRAAVEGGMGYYYLNPMTCPASYASKVLGSRLLASDIADAIRKPLGVPDYVLSSASFTSNGLVMSWLMEGSTANQLSYTAISKTGTTNPDLKPFQGSTNTDCSLLDINPANVPAQAVLVGRVPRAIPGRDGFYICAIAPAGGSVKVSRSSGANRLQYAYTADKPTAYGACPTGSYLYKLGAISSPGDAATDACTQCMRGSFAAQGASLCSACPAGQFQAKMGARGCAPCQFGYATYKGAIRCMNCYYGRPYCSEGWSNNERQYTCNAQRLPTGYQAERGFSIVRPLTDPTSSTIASSYSPMFRSCTINTQQTVMAMNVTGECAIDLYVLGDLGTSEDGCSQISNTNSISAYYTAPNIMAGLSTKSASPGLNVGIQGNLLSQGFQTQVFAAGMGRPVPPSSITPTIFTIGLTPVGFSYLGGGDNGQGQNAMVRGVRQKPCPPGTTLALLNADGSDSPGEDPRKLLNNFCVPCEVGTYCDASSDAVSTCPAGTYGPTIGAKSTDACVNCPVGTYQDLDGAYECKVCDVNTFASAPGATQCSSCGDGYEVSGAGSNFCNPCSPGTFRDSAVSDTCQACPAGTYSGQAAGQCTMCEQGTFAAKQRSSSCEPCARGSFQSKFGRTKCDQCQPGTYQDARGQKMCKVCPVGTFNNLTRSFQAGACNSCPPGTAAPVPGSSKCQKCGAGYFAVRANSPSCSACKPGTFSTGQGASACTPCPRGRFADKSAASGCTACPIGSFSAVLGAAKCQSCAAGSFTNSTGAVTCGRCPPGTYSTRTGASSGITCVQCPAGSFSYMSGSTECMQCPPGQFATKQGSFSCDDCPLGTYSTADGSIRCLPCKNGFTTPSPGSSSAAACSVRTALNAGK